MAGRGAEPLAQGQAPTLSLDINAGRGSRVSCQPELACWAKVGLAGWWRLAGSSCWMGPSTPARAGGEQAAAVLIPVGGVAKRLLGR